MGRRGWGRGHPWVQGRSRISGQAYVDAKSIQMYNTHSTPHTDVHFIHMYTAHRCTRIEKYNNKADKDCIH